VESHDILKLTLTQRNPGMQTVTHDQNEIALVNYLSGSHQIQIPYYQRNYTWSKSQILDLADDIAGLLEDGVEVSEANAHFMGATIVHNVPGVALRYAQPVFVIDGQQRLTTMFLFVLSLANELIANGKIDEGVGYITDYILLKAKTVQEGSNLKIRPAPADCASMNGVVQGVLQRRGVDVGTDYAFTPISVISHRDSPKIEAAYKTISAWAKGMSSNFGDDYLESLIDVVLRNLTIVQIVVRDPLDGPTIFSRLNARGTPLTIGELVKNDIFSRADVSSPEDFRDLETGVWQPFIKVFGKEESNFEKFFFPYGLIQDSNLKKAQVYPSLQKEWGRKHSKPEEIISELKKYQVDYMEICDGAEDLCGHPKDIRQLFKNLRDVKQPTSTYPFLMQLSSSLRKKRTTPEETLEVLEVIESFLVRRAICKYEPTGLHAVFKRLWADLDGATEGLPSLVVESIRKHKTVSWPEDKQVKEFLLNNPLYGAVITPYFLMQYDLSLSLETPSDTPSIEHVLPQTMGKQKCWTEKWSAQEHREQKDLVGNLTLLTPRGNSVNTNACYGKKRSFFQEEAMYRITTKLAEENEDWTPEAIVVRGKEIAKWALKRWAY
jgi:hypothetical protein